MAILNKKFKIKKGNNIQSCNIYSTEGEAGVPNLKIKVEDIYGYVSLKDISDANATSGRIKIDNKAYAIVTQASLPYEEKSWTTPGTYTWTCPSGVTRIRVAVCGGGGGGGNITDYDPPPTNGGSSSFSYSSSSLISATGGGKTTVNGGGAAGQPNGYSGYSTKSDSYNKGHLLSFTNALGDYGRGGGKNPNVEIKTVFVGGSGGYNSNYISTTPLETYTINVGSGGSNGKGGLYGTNGFVLIAFGGEV